MRKKVSIFAGALILFFILTADAYADVMITFNGCSYYTVNNPQNCSISGTQTANQYTFSLTAPTGSVETVLVKFNVAVTGENSYKFTFDANNNSELVMKISNAKSIYQELKTLAPGDSIVLSPQGNLEGDNYLFSIEDPENDEFFDFETMPTSFSWTEITNP